MYIFLMIRIFMMYEVSYLSSLTSIGTTSDITILVFSLLLLLWAWSLRDVAISFIKRYKLPFSHLNKRTISHHHLMSFQASYARLNLIFHSVADDWVYWIFLFGSFEIQRVKEWTFCILFHSFGILFVYSNWGCTSIHICNTAPSPAPGHSHHYDLNVLLVVVQWKVSIVLTTMLCDVHELFRDILECTPRCDEW